MIDRMFAKNQIARFGVLPFPPSNKIAMEELVDTLEKCARSERHAMATVLALLECPGDDRRWPAPDQIRYAANSLLTEEERAPGACEGCGGTQFIISRHKVYDRTFRKFVEYTSARPCQCHAAQTSTDEKVRRAFGLTKGGAAEDEAA